MDVHFETLDPGHGKAFVTIPTDEVADAFDLKTKEVNEQIVLPGFRRGHAPRTLLERRLGKHLREEVRNDLVLRTLKACEEKHAKHFLAPPEIDVASIEIHRDQPFAFEFEYFARPDFALPTYRGVEVVVPPPTIAPEEVQHGIDALRRRAATLTEVPDGVVSDDDFAVVDLSLLAAGEVAFTDEGVWYRMGRGVIGGVSVPDLDARLRGATVGAVAETDATLLDEDDREELRGKPLTLRVEVKAIQRYVLPEVDENFLKSLDFDDEQELRDTIEKDIRRRAERMRGQIIADKVLERLLAETEIPLPTAFIERTVGEWERGVRAKMEEDGATPEQIDEHLAAKRDATVKETGDRLRARFLVERIAAAENIRETERDLQAAVQAIADRASVPVEAVVQHYRESGRFAELASGVRAGLVRDLLREAATVRDA